MERSDINHRFAYHAPNADEVKEAHAEIRTECCDLAQLLNDALPEGREKSTAMTKLEEVMMWANAAIARNQDDAISRAIGHD